MASLRSDSACGWATIQETASRSAKTERIQVSMPPRSGIRHLSRCSDHKAGSSDGVFPSHLQLAFRGAGFRQGDSVSLDGFGRTAEVHRHAAKIPFLVILEARLPGLLINDQLPLLWIKPDEQRVVALGHNQPFELQIRVGMQQGSVVCACAPDLVIRNKPAEDD